MSTFVLDCEVAPNYFLLLMMDAKSGQTYRWERHNDVERGWRSRRDLHMLLSDNRSLSFNGLGYDQWIIAAYLAEFSNRQIFDVSSYIIKTDMGRWQVASEFTLSPPIWDHIDIFAPTPLTASLKAYAARMHAPTIAELPFDPEELIDEPMRDRIIIYCTNDLHCTLELARKINPQLKLRHNLTRQFGIDLLSAGDAQIAEQVLRKEIRAQGGSAKPGQLTLKSAYHYQPPDYIQFHSDTLRDALERTVTSAFCTSEKGSLTIPDALRAHLIFHGAQYKMGIGGLHSQEKSRTIHRGSGEALFELDVASYYPNLILSNQWAPSSIGKPFLDAYRTIVERRLAAKASGDRVTADSLKIVVNASFGKFGNRYSALYDPQLLLQTTLTGQLALLMLIEMITLHTPAQVISANTDGIVVLAPDPDAEALVMEEAAQWEATTALSLERTDYRMIAQQDVNNYFAVKDSGETKGKGLFAPEGLQKNPAFSITTRAVMELLTDGTPVDETIHTSRDIREYVSTRRVNGGALWRGEKVGRTVRWYIGHGGENILNRINESRVALTDGAILCNRMPSKFPDDIDYGFYIAQTNRILKATGNTAH